jgi:hypothetical protein
VSIIALFLLQATLVKAVQDVRDGRADLSISETVNQATPFIGPVALASLLAGIAIFVGFVLIIVPGLILITIWAVIVPVIVIERSGVMASFGRSRELVRGRGWHVFGTLVLVWIILFVADIILGLIFSFVPYAIRDGLASVISGTLVAPFIALVVTLVYYRLVGSMAPAGGGPYGGYQQPQDGGYGSYQQPQGGWQQPPQSGGYPDQPTQVAGWQQPPQGGSDYGGYQQPPQPGGYQQPPPPGGYEGNQPTTQAGGWQQPPQPGGYQQPPPPGGYEGNQPTTQAGGWQQPPQPGGYQQPPQGGGRHGGYSEPPTRMAPRPGYQPPEDDDDDGYGKR